MSIQSEPPKYIVVKESLLESIQHDQLPPRSRLAPIAKMSKHFGVSPSVIQRALNEMINEGFIESRGSSGYYVCDAVLKEGSRPEHTKPEAAAPVPEVSGGNIPPVFLKSCTRPENTA